MNKLYIFIGLPGAGKTTYLQKKLSKCKVISPSKISDSLSLPLSNHESMKFVYKVAVEQASELLKDGFDVVIDDMNLSREQRKLLLEKTPKNVRKVAIFFTAGPDQCRTRKLSHSVSPEELNSLAKQMEVPEYEEGFDSVLIAGANPNILFPSTKTS